MSYLPDEIKEARVLITVKTYPHPSKKYDELVCTAGLMENGKWIRIYPVPFRKLPYGEQYAKYHWITVDLVRNTSDFRQESYKPKWADQDTIKIQEKLETGKNRDWAARKAIVLQQVYTSIADLIAEAKSPARKSLATFKPTEILDFIIEKDEKGRTWNSEQRDQMLQLQLFDLNVADGQLVKQHEPVRKLPYKYFYIFKSEGIANPHRMMIEDWEVGALYWNTLRSCGDEKVANEKVKEKYLNEFAMQKDLHFFLGTTKLHHNVAPNPFMIIGTFHPPKTNQPTLF